MKVETIPCRPVPAGKGEFGYLPTRAIDLKPGDKVFSRTRGNQHFIEIHRCGFLKRYWLIFLGRA